MKGAAFLIIFLAMLCGCTPIAVDLERGPWVLNGYYIRVDRMDTLLIALPYWFQTNPDSSWHGIVPSFREAIVSIPRRTEQNEYPDFEVPELSLMYFYNRFNKMFPRWELHRTELEIYANQKGGIRLLISRPVNLRNGRSDTTTLPHDYLKVDRLAQPYHSLIPLPSPRIQTTK